MLKAILQQLNLIYCHPASSALHGHTWGGLGSTLRFTASNVFIYVL